MTRARCDRYAIRKDIVAGFVNAVVSVPDGLASATLAGVNPVYGLYTSIAAPIAGSALASGQLMQIATTSASALATGRVIGGYPAGEQDQALFLLVALIGVVVFHEALSLERAIGFVLVIAGVVVLIALEPRAASAGSFW